MSLNKLSVLALAGIITAGLVAGTIAQDVVVDPAIASMTPEQMVEARKDAMKEDGGILRSAANLSGAEADAAADKLIRNFTNFPALFPEGSMVGDTDALPVIWQEFEAFTAIFDTAREGAVAMKAAAAAGDAAAYGAALQAIGGTCGQCHQKYRS